MNIYIFFYIFSHSLCLKHVHLSSGLIKTEIIFYITASSGYQSSNLEYGIESFI